MRKLCDRRIDGTAFVLVFAFVFGLLGSLPVWAGELPVPTGKVLLTVSGKVANTNSDQGAQFDRKQLLAMGLHSLQTSNPFIKGVHTFEGVRLADVLNAAGATGETLVARALDGYNVEIPIEDAAKYGVLLAMKMDGKVMRVRTKGPLWIIYPVDQNEELKSESFSGRSIWQLISIDVK